jgi:hypothetical protein
LQLCSSCCGVRHHGVDVQRGASCALQRTQKAARTTKQRGNALVAMPICHSCQSPPFQTARHRRQSTVVSAWHEPTRQSVVLKSYSKPALKPWHVAAVQREVEVLTAVGSSRWVGGRLLVGWHLVYGAWQAVGLCAPPGWAWACQHGAVTVTASGAIVIAFPASQVRGRRRRAAGGLGGRDQPAPRVPCLPPG